MKAVKIKTSVVFLGWPYRYCVMRRRGKEAVDVVSVLLMIDGSRHPAWKSTHADGS